MQERIRKDSARTTTICVDSYENSIPKGRYYNEAENGEGREFNGLMQLIVGMEQILDEANFPQSFTAVRSFGDAVELKAASAGSAPKKGEAATFTVKIFYRQHTSWQGSVVWQEKGVEQPFRSVLELILLIDSALS